MFLYRSLGRICITTLNIFVTTSQVSGRELVLVPTELPLPKRKAREKLHSASNMISSAAGEVRARIREAKKGAIREVKGGITLAGGITLVEILGRAERVETRVEVGD